MPWRHRTFSDYAIPIGLTIAVLVFQWLVREVRSRRAQSWPTVDGTVERVRTHEEGHESFKDAPAHALYYSYKVQGEFYSGIETLESGISTFDFPEGTRVLVHYKASQPSVSFLDREHLRSRIGAEG
jgi:Protein of unknown function (DUF3592)